MVSSCHSALPRSDDAILSKHPKLKEFTFVVSYMEDFSFYYRILRTCIGQVKRLIKWTGSLGPCAYNGNCYEIPSLEEVVGGDEMPKAICDDMHCLEFLLAEKDTDDDTDNEEFEEDYEDEDDDYEDEDEDDFDTRFNRILNRLSKVKDVDNNEDDDKKILVSGIRFASVEDLAFYFKSFGVIKDVNDDEKYGDPPSGYVVFEDESAVEKVMAQDSHTLRNGTIVNVRRVKQSQSGASGGED